MGWAVRMWQGKRVFSLTGALIYSPLIIPALLLPTPPRNSVAPNSFTSYFVLRTSYLITPVSSRRKAIAHHEARIFLGTDVGL